MASPGRAPKRHVHLNIELKDTQFNYHEINDGHTYLHPGETMSFQSEREFSIRFKKGSPFAPADPNNLKAQPVRQPSGSWLVTAQVADDAAIAHYPYQIVVAPQGNLPAALADPEIIVISVEKGSE